MVRHTYTCLDPHCLIRVKVNSFTFSEMESALIKSDLSLADKSRALQVFKEVCDNSIDYGAEMMTYVAFH
jgi:hypothetical protein